MSYGKVLARKSIAQLRRLEGFSHFVFYGDSDGQLLQHFTAIRWQNGAFCPACGHRKIYHFQKAELHKCANCRKRFSIKTGTIFERSKLPIAHWVRAILYLTGTQRPTSAGLAEEINVPQPTAWKMIQLLVKAAQTKSFNRQLVQLEPRRKKFPTLSPAIKQALASITATINLSTGLDHPGDALRAQRILEKIRAQGHRLNASAITRWAIDHNWDEDSAGQLAALARTIDRN